MGAMTIRLEPQAFEVFGCAILEAMRIVPPIVSHALQWIGIRTGGMAHGIGQFPD
jgi:hypothetical protein